MKKVIKAWVRSIVYVSHMIYKCIKTKCSCHYVLYMLPRRNPDAHRVSYIFWWWHDTWGIVKEMMHSTCCFHGPNRITGDRNLLKNLSTTKPLAPARQEGSSEICRLVLPSFRGPLWDPAFQLVVSGSHTVAIAKSDIEQDLASDWKYGKCSITSKFQYL